MRAALRGRSVRCGVQQARRAHAALRRVPEAALWGIMVPIRWKGAVAVGETGACRRAWTSFGFVVLVLVYQRAYSFYTTLSMDYQVVLGLASALSWIALLVLGERCVRRAKGCAILSLALLAASFVMQEVYLLRFGAAAASDALLLGSTTLFSMGFAGYCRLWLVAYEEKSLQDIVICLSGSSALSAALACLPPLIFGLGEEGSLASFGVRLGSLFLSFWCLRAELLPVANVPDQKRRSEGGASLGEAWGMVGLVVVAVFASRFVQGLLILNEDGYRDYGAQVLLVVSPLISAGIIALVGRFGQRTGFISPFYWSLTTCLLVVLLVAAAVSDSSISFLWVLLFAVYAQMDVAFFGMLASMRGVLGSSFSSLACLAFCAKDLLFSLGRMLRAAVDVPTGCFICVVVLLAAVVAEIAVYLLQTLKRSHERDEPASIPEALCASIGARHQLTPREGEVLLALLQGRSYTNIGHRLFISKSTVKTHANHIYAKLGVGSRDELIDLLDPKAQRGEDPAWPHVGSQCGKDSQRDGSPSI